jgi:hypothetical protein
MGIRTVATEIVYLIDFSGSMENVDGRPQMLKQELERSIRALRAGSKFTVVMFGQSPGAGAHVVKRADGGEDSDNYVAMPPAGEWITAGARNTADAVSWVAKRRIDAAANSDIAPAMEMILGMRPQAIFLLTDGAFDTTAFRALQQAIEKGNPGRDVQINTVALTESDAAGGSDVYDLQLLASQNNGTYRRVTVGK